jgi:hypothetical protein
LARSTQAPSHDAQAPVAPPSPPPVVVVEVLLAVVVVVPAAVEPPVLHAKARGEIGRAHV